MTGPGAIAPVGSIGGGAAAIVRLGLDPQIQAQPNTGASFGSILSTGLVNVDRKIAHADDMVRQFAIDDSVPVHQVTLALEEARLAIELAMQVRSRIVEGYRELMNMQL